MNRQENMSVELTSKNGEISENICNGSWAAIVACARAYEHDRIPDWNGCHDGDQLWTPEQLEVMADRIEQTAALIPILRDLAQAGGVVVS